MGNVQYQESRLNSNLLSASELVNALDRLGVYFLRGRAELSSSEQIDPAILLSGLAASDEARIRLALIPLFLQRPDFAAHVHIALQRSTMSAQIVLKCYYMAALLLQQKYRSQLNSLFGEQDTLPDLFSDNLDLALTPDPDQGLSVLAERHKVLSGKSLNWQGTYEHGAQRLLAHMEKRRLWAI